MKKLIIVLLLLASGSFVFGQATIYKEKLYAPGLKDSVSYTVYVPQDWEGWDAERLHPTIYAINYGMINGDYIAAQVAYFRKARYAMPNSLIVVVDASMERMGYQYKTGEVTAEGHQFITFLKELLIPAITQKYHTSGFRSYLGHSFAASFGSYLIRTEPGLFNGYLLLAPEKVGTEAPFRLPEKVLSELDRQYTFVYSAVGQKDLQRRKDFAREIYKEMSRVQAEHRFLQMDTIVRADHTNILTLAFEFGLEHIYQFYTPYSGKKESDAFADLQQVAGTIKRYYGLDLEHNFTFYSPFVHEAIENKDSAALEKILAYFDVPGLKGWNLMQFGEACLQLNDRGAAARCFAKAIDLITKQEMNASSGPPNLLVCYRHMAFDIYPEDHEKAWGYLINAKNLMESGNKWVQNDGDALLDLGAYAARAGYRADEALNYLMAYQQGHHERNYKAAYYAALICQRVGKPEDAKKYIRLAVQENATDPDTAALARELGIH